VCQVREEISKNILKYFLDFSKEGGGVTPQGGRTTWGRGKEWRAMNARRGVEGS
jgi:hypothetical protein